MSDTRREHPAETSHERALRVRDTYQDWGGALADWGLREMEARFAAADFRARSYLWFQANGPDEKKPEPGSKE